MDELREDAAAAAAWVESDRERERKRQVKVGRRGLGLGLAAAAAALSRAGPSQAAAKFDSKQLDELNKLFGEAIELSKLGGEESFAPADEAWTKIIEFSPETSAAWSNRGTFRLQRYKPTFFILPRPLHPTPSFPASLHLHSQQ